MDHQDKTQLDGRRRRAPGDVRDTQINFKISRDTKARIVATARRLGRPMVWVLERGLRLVEAEEAASKKKAKSSTT